MRTKSTRDKYRVVSAHYTITNGLSFCVLKISTTENSLSCKWDGSSFSRISVFGKRSFNIYFQVIVKLNIINGINQ